MNAKQRNQLAMFIAVKNVFGTYPSEFQTIPAFDSFINEFYTQLSQIEAVYQIQIGNITGRTQLKQKEEKEMIEATIRTAAAMYVYAQVNNMPDLMAKCKVSAWILEKLSAVKLKTICLNIYEEAAKLNDALSNYGISAEKVAQLKKEIDDFDELIGAPRAAIVTRSQARQELVELMDTTNDLLRNKVDKLMELLKETYTKVYNTYKAARIIVDLRAGKQVVEVE